MLASWSTWAFQAISLPWARPERLRNSFLLTEGTPATFPGDGFVRVAQHHVVRFVSLLLFAPGMIA